jgi:hypothetical protein
MGSVLTLLGYGLVIVIVFGVLLFATAFRMTVDDPAISQESDIPEVGAMAEKGWKLVYSAEDNDHFMLSQVYESDSGVGFRAILSETSNPPSIESDLEYSSLDQAKAAADDWANAYKEEED